MSVVSTELTADDSNLSSSPGNSRCSACPEARATGVDMAWGLAVGMLLIVEPGTPEGFAAVRTAREALLAESVRTIAPCAHDRSCPLERDWCHFPQWLKRPDFQRRARRALGERTSMNNSPHSAASHFPVTHSVLSTAALITEVLPEYDIGTTVECKLLDRSLNDTYLVKTTDGRYILRVYRTHWRSPSEIGYELDALIHLARKGLSLSVPLARKDNSFIRTLRAPEGERQVVLFTYANGEGLTHEGAQSELYGRAVATIHAATDDFISQHNRFELNLTHLIDQPLAAIQPFLKHRPDDWAYLQGMADRVRKRLDRFQREQPDFGFCHGDFHGGNAHIDAANTITFFDFDCCGAGWRAYDIAVFRWAAGREDASWEAFLKGYQECRRLAVRDLAAVPWFVAARHIWLLGLHTGNAQDWGCGWMNDAYFDSGGAGGLKFLREWEAEHLNNEAEPL